METDTHLMFQLSDALCVCVCVTLNPVIRSGSGYNYTVILLMLYSDTPGEDIMVFQKMIFQWLSFFAFQVSHSNFVFGWLFKIDRASISSFLSLKIL